MPTTTLELPREIVSAARMYAEREHCTVADLFESLMNRRYGVSLTLAVAAKSSPKARRRKVRIPATVKSISGIITLPGSITEADIAYEATLSN